MAQLQTTLSVNVRGGVCKCKKLCKSFKAHLKQFLHN